MRMFMLFSLLLAAACSAGSQGHYATEDLAVSRSYPYIDPTSDLNRPAERWDMNTCPEAMPTGGSLASDHEGVGPFYCDF